MGELKLLQLLAEKGAMQQGAKLSTVALAKEFDLSQQSISRKLIALEEDNYITRKLLPEGMQIFLTQKGKQLLHKQYRSLKNIFEMQIPELQGKVTSGLGEGKYYMETYKPKFQQHMNMTPYLGTLNLKVDSHAVESFLQTLTMKYLPGFENNKRTFGGVKCYQARLKKKSVFLIVPDRTTHDTSVIEIVAPYNLRDQHKLKDGDIVKLTSE